MRNGWFIIAGALVATSLSAAAQDKSLRAWPSQSQRWTPQLPDCTCRAQGRDFRMGETTCLRTAEGDRLAVCGMVLNNSSWKLSSAPCTISSAPMSTRLAAN